ncbi:MAG TPA: BON domain-containing protein [Acidobacteriaceae bacterium]|jgi:osmotically-inducible protein OsmY
MITSDLMLKQHVENELGWEPSVNSIAIGIGVRDAVVTISGQVQSYAQKHTAGEVVLRIRGVRAVANELTVKLPGESERSDEEIAHAIASVFAWDATIPKNCIRVEVSQGWVTLAGTVEWHYQRIAAASAVRGLLGVRGFSNTITVDKVRAHTIAHAEIEAAISRTEADSIENFALRIDGATLVLTGKVPSSAVRNRIERIAWKSPGVADVKNLLEVETGAAVFELVGDVPAHAGSAEAIADTQAGDHDTEPY